MKRILVSNISEMMVSFTVNYSLSGSTKVTEITSGKFVKPLFRVIEIPEQAIDIVVTIQTVDSKGKKKTIGGDRKPKAINVCYEVYKNMAATQFRVASCPRFTYTCSIYGINTSSKIIRLRVLYMVGKEGKYYISDPVKQGQSFAFVTPNNAEQIQVKIEKAKDITAGIWSNIYTEVLSKDPYPRQKCYSITKPKLKDLQCKVVDCSKV